MDWAVPYGVRPFSFAACMSRQNAPSKHRAGAIKLIFNIINDTKVLRRSVETTALSNLLPPGGADHCIISGYSVTIVGAVRRFIWLGLGPF